MFAYRILSSSLLFYFNQATWPINTQTKDRQTDRQRAKKDTIHNVYNTTCAIKYGKTHKYTVGLTYRSNFTRSPIALITVCTVVQNCCKGRSKKYRKWHFWECFLSETRLRIDIIFDSDHYVGDESQCAKWHISRFRGVISTKSEMLMVCAFYFFIFYFLFFVCSLAPLGVKQLDRF